MMAKYKKCLQCPNSCLQFNNFTDVTNMLQCIVRIIDFMKIYLFACHILTLNRS